MIQTKITRTCTRYGCSCPLNEAGQIDCQFYQVPSSSPIYVSQSKSKEVSSLKVQVDDSPSRKTEIMEGFIDYQPHECQSRVKWTPECTSNPGIDAINFRAMRQCIRREERIKDYSKRIEIDTVHKIDHVIDGKNYQFVIIGGHNVFSFNEKAWTHRDVNPRGKRLGYWDNINEEIVQDIPPWLTKEMDDHKKKCCDKAICLRYHGVFQPYPEEAPKDTLIEREGASKRTSKIIKRCREDFDRDFPEDPPILVANPPPPKSPTRVVRPTPTPWAPMKTRSSSR
jgi:hypothetical protein